MRTKIFQFSVSFIILILFFTCNLYAQFRALSGDLGIPGKTGYTITATLKIASVPFEGITLIKDTSLIQYNRYNNIQNGSIWRYFRTQNIKVQYNLDFISAYGNTDLNILDLGHSSGGEFPDSSIMGVWGYAKYQVIISIVGTNTNEKYTFYFNSLDSKYGKYLPNGDLYTRDWYFEFEPNLQVSRRLVIKNYRSVIGMSSVDTIATWDTLPNGLPSKEIKVWKSILNIDTVYERNFYARTTPFPISPITEENHNIGNLILGTKVILDTVYQNFGALDRNGYNTLDTPGTTYNRYYTNPPVPYGYNDSGNTYTTPAYYYEIPYPPYVIFGMKLTLDSNDAIILRKSKKLWICGSGPNLGGDTILMKHGSYDSLGINSSIRTFSGGVLIDSGSNTIWNPQSHYRAFLNSTISFMGTNHIVNNGAHVEINGNATLKVGDNTTITFDGAGTYLKLDSNSIVKLGANAKIKFTNGAYLNANGAAFSALGSSAWSGIEFENAGSSTDTSSITNCTFNNAISPIQIKNDEEHSANGITFTNNTFNLPSSGMNSAIYAENAMNLLIQNNNFSMTSNSISIGFYLKNYVSFNEPAIDVLNNYFYYGSCSIVLASYVDNNIPVYIDNNHFISNTSYNIIGRMITGNIKNNFTESGSPDVSISLFQSNPNLFKNTFFANQINILNNNSYPRLAPILHDNDQLDWLGGQNQLRLTQNPNNLNNIYFSNANAFLDYGQNIFLKQIAQYHLLGSISPPPESSPEYYLYVRDNCFENQNTPPEYSLVNSETNQRIIAIWDGITFNCNIHNDFSGYELFDKGFGIYDTLFTSPKYFQDTASIDFILYSDAEQNKLNYHYFNAINGFKNLINNYLLSNYLNSSLYELYQCYVELDTCVSQAYKNLLYGNLKSYLENRINSENYSEEFVDIAYNFIAMCMVNMNDCDEALEAYQFIALFNPDPYISLFASWDYELLEELIGEGGSVSERYNVETDEMFKERRIKYFEKLIAGDPVKNKVKKAYESLKLKRDYIFEKELRKSENNQNNLKSIINERKNKDNIIRDKIVSNLRILKYLTKTEKDKKQLEDIFLVSQGDYKISNSKVNSKSSIPEKYELSQNYPNPFNPVTKINYAIPKQSLTTLKIYDVLGREVMKLVNEMKQPGMYSIDFDGTYLSSGVYFYKLESGTFSNVKRMVLVK